MSMNIKDIEPGRYACKIADFGLEEVEKLKAIKAVIVVEFTDAEFNGTQMKWDGFLLTKDGNANKKTASTLKACGLQAGVETLATDIAALDKNKELFATVILDQNGYKRIEWINDGAESGAMNKIQDVKKINGMDLRKFNESMGANVKPDLKNHAPKASDTDEIPF